MLLLDRRGHDLLRTLLERALRCLDAQARLRREHVTNGERGELHLALEHARRNRIRRIAEQQRAHATAVEAGQRGVDTCRKHERDWSLARLHKRGRAHAIDRHFGRLLVGALGTRGGVHAQALLALERLHERSAGRRVRLVDNINRHRRTAAVTGTAAEDHREDREERHRHDEDHHLRGAVATQTGP